MATNVGELQVTIGADISKFDKAVDKAVKDMAKFGNTVVQNSTNIDASFLRVEGTVNRIANFLQSRGIAPVREAINAVKKAMRELEKEEKTHLKNIEKERKRHIKELEKQAKEREKAAVNAGIYGGLSGGIIVGGRLGFAGGYFGSRIGTRVGGSFGAGIGRAIGRATGGAAGEERLGSAGGNIGGTAGGLIGFGTMMPVIYAGQKVFQLIQFSVEKIWEGMKAVVDVTWKAVKAAFNLGLEYEKNVITFQTLLGSEAKGKRLYEDIEKFAIKSPYRTSKLIGPAQTLLGAGVSEDNVMPVLKRIGDIAGGDYDRMNRLMKAFTDVMAKGVLQGEERRQFGNVGIGLKDFAETAGVTTSKFQKMMRAGEIDSNVVIETVNRLTSEGGRFHNLSLNVATKTVGGALESIAETFEQFGSRIGRSFFEKFRVGETLRKFLDILDNFDMSGIEAWMDRAQKGLSNLGKFFNVDVAKSFFENFIEKIRSFLPEWKTVGKTIEDGMVKWIPSLVDGFKLAATAGIGFVEVLVKIANAVGAILAGMADWIPGIKTYTDKEEALFKQEKLLIEADPDKAFSKFKKDFLVTKAQQRNQKTGAGGSFDSDSPEGRAEIEMAWMKHRNRKLEGFNIDALKKEMPGSEVILESLDKARAFIDNIERPNMYKENLTKITPVKENKFEEKQRESTDKITNLEKQLEETRKLKLFTAPMIDKDTKALIEKDPEIVRIKNAIKLEDKNLRTIIAQQQNVKNLNQQSEDNRKIRTVQSQLPLEVRNIIEDLEKQGLKGFTNLDQYKNYEKNLRIGRFGQNGIAGELSSEEYSQGLINNFNNLAKTLEKVGDRLPQTQYYGSSEAQATINNTILQNQTKDIQQQILDVLKQAEIENKIQTDLNRQMATALKKIAGGDPLEDALDFMFN